MSRHLMMALVILVLGITAGVRGSNAQDSSSEAPAGSGDVGVTGVERGDAEDIYDTDSLFDDELDEDSLFDDELAVEDPGAASPADTPADEADTPPADATASADAEATGPTPGEPAGYIEDIRIVGAAYAPLVESPVSVTLFDQEDLKAQGTSDIRDLAQHTPNLEIKTAYAASNPTLFIRGVGLKDYFSNSQSSVAVWNDEVYANSPTGQLFQLFDIDSIEVLRGARGGLYGRNATAGVIRVSPRKPSGEVGGYGFLEYGNLDHVLVEGAVETPIVEDVLSMRVAGRANWRDGWMKNRCATTAGRAAPRSCGGRFVDVQPGVARNVNDRDNWAARGMLRWQPAESWDWNIAVSGGQNRSFANQFQKLGTQPEGSVTPGTSGVDTANYRDPDLGGSGFLAGSGDVLDGDPRRGDFNVTGDEKVDLFAAKLRGDYLGDDFEITTITALNTNERDTVDNADASPTTNLEIHWTNEARTITQDLRLKYAPVVPGNYSISAGGWFLEERLEVDNRFRTSQSIVLLQMLDQDQRAWAAFLEGSYQLAETINLEGAIRYNWDRKDYTAKTGLQLRNLPPFRNPQAKEDEIWSAMTGQLTVNYLPTEEINFYFRFAHGYKAGQFNGAVFAQTIAEGIRAADPETVETFELGWKTATFDGLLEFDGAFFYNRYTDQQVFQLKNTIGAVPTPELVNANDAITFGIEATLGAELTEWLRLSMSLGYLNSEYLDFQNRLLEPTSEGGLPVRPEPLVVDYSGSPLINAPTWRWTGHLRADYPVTGGSLIGRFGWSYTTEVFFDPNRGKGQTGDYPVGTIGQPDLWLLDLLVGFRTGDDAVEITGWVRNLTEEDYKVDGFDIDRGFSSILFVIGQPRTYGLGLTVNF